MSKPLIKFSYALAAILIFAIEFLIATRWKHVAFVRSDLGDYLVVILLFCMLKAVWDAPSRRLATGIFVFACFVEFMQGISLADRLGFARGSWQSIVIGTNFNWSDIAMYAAGCLTAGLIGVKVDRR